MDEPTKIDPQLFFKMDHCEAKHYLFGNAHTFPGRILAWCEKKQGSFFISKSDIVDPSSPVKYWVEGFLKGNELTPPKDKGGMTDFKSQKYLEWQKKVKHFHESGLWE